MIILDICYNSINSLVTIPRSTVAHCIANITCLTDPIIFIKLFFFWSFGIIPTRGGIHVDSLGANYLLQTASTNDGFYFFRQGLYIATRNEFPPFKDSAYLHNILIAIQTRLDGKAQNVWT